VAADRLSDPAQIGRRAVEGAGGALVKDEGHEHSHTATNARRSGREHRRRFVPVAKCGSLLVDKRCPRHLTDH